MVFRWKYVTLAILGENVHTIRDLIYELRHEQ